MDKLKLAHDWAMKSFLTNGFKDEAERAIHAWKYADAMQAEAEERECKERPEALCEVDWRVAPKNAFQWQMINNEAYWRIVIMGGLDTEPAPSFGFTGSHIVERPHGF